MAAPDRDNNSRDCTQRPFNGVISTRHGADHHFNLQVAGPRRGFTAAQLRGIALLIDRCCTHPVATLTQRGAIDLGEIDTRWQSTISSALVEFHLADDDADDDDAPGDGVAGLCTNPWYGMSISVDQLLRLAGIMVEFAIDHVAFGQRRVAYFSISRDTPLPAFQSALRELGFFQRGGLVCTPR
jgi:hypothetical protein